MLKLEKRLSHPVMTATQYNLQSEKNKDGVYLQNDRGIVSCHYLRNTNFYFRPIKYAKYTAVLTKHTNHYTAINTQLNKTKQTSLVFKDKCFKLNT